MDFTTTTNSGFTLLDCPRCRGGVNGMQPMIHLDRAVVQTFTTDDGDPIGTVSLDYNGIVRFDPPASPDRGRPDFFLGGWCEWCRHQLIFAFHQHKGETQVSVTDLGRSPRHV